MRTCIPIPFQHKPHSLDRPQAHSARFAQYLNSPSTTLLRPPRTPLRYQTRRGSLHRPLRIHIPKQPAALGHVHGEEVERSVIPKTSPDKGRWLRGFVMEVAELMFPFGRCSWGGSWEHVEHRLGRSSWIAEIRRRGRDDSAAWWTRAPVRAEPRPSSLAVPSCAGCVSSCSTAFRAGGLTVEGRSGAATGRVGFAFGVFAVAGCADDALAEGFVGEAPEGAFLGEVGG